MFKVCGDWLLFLLLVTWQESREVPAYQNFNGLEGSLPGGVIIIPLSIKIHSR